MKRTFDTTIALLIWSYGQFVGAAFAQDVRIERVKYPVIESSYVVHHIPTSTEIEWIDNDRVIFTGYEDGVEEMLPNGSRVLKQGIYIFDSRTATGTRHADGLLECFSRGYMRYVTKSSSGREVTRAGMLGTEQDLNHRQPSLQDKVENKFSCKLYDRKEVPQHAGIAVRLLFEDHGNLNLTYASQKTLNDPVHLTKPNGGEVALPFLQRDMRLPKIKYYPHQNVYLIYDWRESELLDRSNPSSPRRVGVAKKLFLMNPNGEVQTLGIPYHNWHRGFGQFYLTARGVIMVSRARNEKVNVFHHEVFLIESDRWELVLDGGSVTNAAVSPDGCKIALGIAKVARPKERPVLNTVDLCRARRK